MATTGRALLVATLAILLVLTGAATRVAATPPAGTGTAAEAATAPEAADEGFPTWAQWTLAGVAIATGLALLLAFVIVPAAIEDSVENVDPCCNGGGGNGSDDGGVL